MELTEYQHEQMQIAMQQLEILAEETKTANYLRIILIVSQGFCWISVVYLVALYVFRRIP